HVEDDQLAPAEAGLAAEQVEFPHAAEAFAHAFLEFVAALLEAVVPALQGLCIVQPPYFQVGQDQAAALDGGGGFRQGRDVATGKDVFADPVLRAAGRAVGLADGVDEAAAAGFEQARNVVEEDLVLRLADM